MTSKRASFPPTRDDSLPRFISPALWHHVIEALHLPAQQARVVSLILRGKHDKQIAIEMNLARSTIRTHLRRVFDHVGVDDRVGVVLRVFEISVEFEK